MTYTKAEVGALCERLEGPSYWKSSDGYVEEFNNAPSEASTMLRALADENEDLTENINLKADFIEKTIDQLRAADERAQVAEARAIAAEEALRSVKFWAGQRCPCTNEEPNPCPLCGASVENLEACKAVDETFPRDILRQINADLAQKEGE